MLAAPAVLLWDKLSPYSVRIEQKSGENTLQRIPEPELMEDPEQAKAYDEADFSAAHGRRVTLFGEKYGRKLEGLVLDLGCGSGDVLERFAKANPAAHFLGVDGAEAMLELSRARMARAGLSQRMSFVNALIPSPAIPRQDYAVVMCHSLLHQLHKPEVLWQTVRAHAGPKSFVFIADLRRPENKEKAAAIVEELSGGEPEVLRRDFYNSLCAAFTTEEIRAQLAEAGLKGLKVEEAGDIHILVYGTVAA
jgi:2-polyprenyl-3-methyl-5-hydroxy-6-metoxy-1,4-benzoquinol methylase